MIQVIIGTQWGDEGKGKIVDLLSQKADYVVRFHGGNNTGHTVINKYGKFPLHFVPAGIFNLKCKVCIANGVIIDPDVLITEIETLQRNISMTAWQEIQEGKFNPMTTLLMEDIHIKKYFKQKDITRFFDVKSHIGDAPQRACQLCKNIRKEIISHE